MILERYFGRRFFISFMAVTITMIVIMGLIDLMDELGDFPELAFGQVLGIVLLKLPEAYYEIIPLVMILASVALFLRLARSSEMVVLRASGRSALRGLLAPAAVALAIGLLGWRWAIRWWRPPRNGITIWSTATLVEPILILPLRRRGSGCGRGGRPARR